MTPDSSMADRIVGLPVKTWLELISDLDEDVTENKLIGRCDPDDDSNDEPPVRDPPDNNTASSPGAEPLEVTWEQAVLPDCTAVKRGPSGWCWFSGIVGRDEDVGLATQQALETLNSRCLVSFVLRTLLLQTAAQEQHGNIYYNFTS